jgi:dTDP-4-dehydrorhamnose reductase
VVRRAAAPNFPYGLYHVAGKGKTSWHAYAVHVIERARQHRWPIRVSPGLILPITKAEYPTRTNRPDNTYLDSTKFINTFKLEYQTWEEGIDLVLNNIFLNQLPLDSCLLKVVK